MKSDRGSLNFNRDINYVRQLMEAENIGMSQFLSESSCQMVMEYEHRNI